MNQTRRVAVKIALDGYEDYRATVAKLNNANKLFASELGILNKQLAANSTDMNVLKEKHEVLKKAFDNQREAVHKMADALKIAKDKQSDYAKKVEESEAKVKAAREALETYKNSSDVSEDKVKELKQALDDANKELDENRAYLEAANRGVVDMSIQYNNAKSKLYDYEKELVDNKIAQDKANGTYKEGATYVGELGTEYKTTAEATDEFQTATENAITALANSEAFKVLQESLSVVKDVLKDCVDEAVNFESAFAGVAKTWSGSEEDLAAYSDTIKEMALRLPSTTAEIAKVSETAGQLGIHTKDMEKFTETMIGLGNATDITADEAAMLAAQFNAVNDFGTENIDKFASAVVWLGNNSATTESKIMQMAQRLASAGSQAGLSAQDILGVATALSSTGIAADAGGGSFSKFIVTLQTAVETGSDKLEEYAKVAGMTAKEFADQWKKDPVVAIQGFVDGLAAAGDEGKSAIGVLQELGLTEIRMRNALLSLASGENKLTKYVQGSNKAWEENVALQNEVNKRYQTTESQMKIFNNTVDALKREVGDALLPVINDVLKGVAPIITSVATFIKENPILVKTLAEVVTVLLTITTAVVSLSKVINALNILGLLGSPWGAVAAAAVAAITVITLGLNALSESYEETARSVEDFRTVNESYRSVMDDLNNTYNESITQVEGYGEEALKLVDHLESLEKAGLDTAEAQEEYRLTVEKLNALLPDLNLVIDAETGKVKGGTQAVRDNIQAWKDKMKLEAYQKKYQGLIERQIELEDEAIKLNNEKEEVIRKSAKANADVIKLETELRELNEKAIHAEGGELIELQNRINQINDNEMPKALAAQKAATAEFENVTQAIKDNETEQRRLQGEMSRTEESMGFVTEKAEETGEAIVESFDISDDLKRKADESMGAYTKRLREAGMDEGTITKIKNFYLSKLPTDFKSQGKSAGQSYVEGIIIGLGTKNTTLKTTAQGIAKIVNGKVTQTWMEKSPSRVAMKYGAYYVEGLSLGMESEEKNLSKQAKDIAETANKAMDHSLDAALIFGGDDGTLKLDSGRQTVQIKADSDTQKRLDSVELLLQRYLPAMANMQVVMNSGELVGSLAPKIDEYFANEQLAHERGM